MRIRHWPRLVTFRSAFLLGIVLNCSRLFSATAPVLTSLSPPSTPAGTTNFVLSVNGTGFVSGASVLWNQFGIYTTTTFVSSTQLNASLDDSLLKQTGTGQITVQNPDGGISNALTFTITAASASNPVPALAFFSPSSATAGGVAFTLTITGSNFLSSSVVQWNGSNRTTTFVSSSQLTVTITVGDIATSGTAQVTVVNPAPGGGISNALTFTINPAVASNPVPALALLSPSSGAAGGAAFTLTVNGSNFVSSSALQWSGSNRTTTFVSISQLKAAITASDISKAGTAQVTVVNPAPGGGASNALTFTIKTVLPPGNGAIQPTCVFPAGPHPSADAPAAVAVDPVHSRIYVVHRGIYRDLGLNANGSLPTDVVSVVEQKSGNIVTTIQVGHAVNGLDQGIAVDSTRNRVYVGNEDDSTVSVIDSTTNTVVATTNLVGNPHGIAADPAKGFVYVATGIGGNSLIVLDAASGGVVGTVPLGGPGVSVAVDSKTHLVYVQVEEAPTTIVAVNPDTKSILGQVPLSLIYTIHKIAVDPGTRVYASDYNSGVIAVIDITGSAPKELNRIFTSISYAESLAVDPATHFIYATFSGDNKVRILSSDGTILKTLDVLRLPTSIAIDSTTGSAYVTDAASDSLSVLDTSRQVVANTIPLGTAVFGVAFDPVAKRLYVTNTVADAVSVVDASSRTLVGNWLSGPAPFVAAVDPGVQQLYVTEPGGSALAILSTANGQLKAKVGLVTEGYGLVVNLRTHRVYAVGANNVTVLDGLTNQIVATIPVGSRPEGIALDDTTGKVYVANLGDITVSVIDSAANQVTATFPVPHPSIRNGLTDVAVDPGLRRLYGVLHPTGIGDFSGLEVLDADTGKPITQLALGSEASRVIVNPSTHQVFVSDYTDGTVTIIDGSSAMVVATVAAGSAALDMALDPGSGVVYVTNVYDGTVACVGPLQGPGINPAPALSSLALSSVTAGGAAFTLTINGSNFLSSSVVQWNGSNRTTTFVGSSQLTVAITAADIATAGTAQVTVVNPAPGGGISTALTFTINAGPPGNGPSISAGGIVNGGSFSKQPPAPASIGSLFGINLAISQVFATTLPLPTSLGGVSVQINGFSAPLFFVSPTQINFQFPWELLGQPSASRTAARNGVTSTPAEALAPIQGFVTVTVNGVKSIEQMFNLALYGPAVFATNQQGFGQGVIQIANTTVFAAPQDSIPEAQARPAGRGEFVTIYCTGLGDVTNRPVTGAAASSNPLSLTIATSTVTIGGVQAPVSFSGLSPGFVGLYQVNVQVPQDAPTGDAVPVLLTIGGVPANTMTMAVQ